MTPEEERREIRAFLRLRQMQGLGDLGIRRWVLEHGSGCAALEAATRQGELWPRQDPEREVQAWEEEGFHVLPQTSPRYPPSVLHLVDPPPLLFLKGRTELLSSPALAIVGSRRATEVGRRTAEGMAGILAGAGITVVSGMALGIDGAAHQGALDRGGPTVAVLGCGLRVPYPRSHRPLWRRIGQEGLLVSEFLPGEEARPHHFPRRNRIIAALARAVVVVEAGTRSGALITVDHALDLGRDVFAVPGSVENPQARGANALLRDGARVLPALDSLLEELTDLFPELLPAAERPGSGHAAVPGELRRIWSALSSEPVSVDEIVRRSSASQGEALAGLSALELGGWARQCPGMRFQRG